MKTLMAVVVDKLRGYGFLEGIHDDCFICDTDPDKCVVLKECVQSLMKQRSV